MIARPLWDIVSTWSAHVTADSPIAALSATSALAAMIDADARMGDVGLSARSRWLSEAEKIYSECPHQGLVSAIRTPLQEIISGLDDGTLGARD
jgi:hypothetical protein